MYKKLIVPLDGSEKAEAVLSFVENLAAIFNSEIILLGVSGERGINVPRLMASYLGNIMLRLKSNGLQAQQMLLSGNAGEEIIKYSNQNSSSLLILANYGASVTSHWLLGDLTAKILLRTMAPMLLIPEKRFTLSKENAQFKRILVPLDTSPEGETALQVVLELAHEAASRLFLLHVIPSIQKNYGLMNYALNFEKQLCETLRKEGEEYFQKISGKLSPENLDIKYEIVSGTPAEGILSYAETTQADLVAISTHGRTGIKRFVLGSVARQVVFSSDTPVLVIRSKIT